MLDDHSVRILKFWGFSVCGKEKVAGIFSIICATHIFTKLLKLFPDYKDQSAQSKIIISAYPLGHKWIAETQKSWMTIGEHILLDWIRFAVFGSGNPLAPTENMLECRLLARP
jgi:hypothetical protein